MAILLQSGPAGMGMKGGAQPGAESLHGPPGRSQAKNADSVIQSLKYFFSNWGEGEWG